MNTENNNTALALVPQNDLRHLTELKEKIIDHKNQFKDLTIADENDEEGYEAVRKAIGVLRPLRTGLEAERKSVVKPYNDFVGQINSGYKEISEMIVDGPGGEAELKSKKERIDNILEERKKAEDAAREKKINDRVNQLISLGMAFDGSYYSIKSDESILPMVVPETSIGMVDLRTMSDEIFAQLLEVVKHKSEQIAGEKARLAEIKRKADAEKAEKVKKEREEFEQKQKDLEKEQEAFREQQKELQKKQDEIAERERKIEQDRVAGVLASRSYALVNMGLFYNDNLGSFDYENESLISVALITDPETTDQKWHEVLETLKQDIDHRKAKAEEFLREQQKQEEARNKRIEDERQAGLDDMARLMEYIGKLKSVQIPVFKGRKYKPNLTAILNAIDDNTPS